MADLPSGTVTFLFTDIEGSTARWEGHPEAMRVALARHDALIHAAIVEHHGHVVKTMGDAFHAAFARAPDALAAALDAQRRLQAEPWGEVGPLRVRMALHTGAAEERDGDYYGPALNRAARLLATGHGGQVLLSDVTAGLVRDDLSGGLELLDLGEHRLKDLIRPERVFQVVVPGLCSEFPPLVSLDARPNNLPTHATPLLGREHELEVARERLLRQDVRLLTLIGPGGTGKTRLSLQLAADLSDRFADGVFFVALVPISDPDLVPATIAQTLGVRDAGRGRPVLDGLREYLREKQVLLLLDNFEQILAAAPVVSELLGAGPRVKILVTSRAALQVRGEYEFPVPPLALPDPNHLPTVEALSQYGAVALFIERAIAIKPDFMVTSENAPAVVEICARLDGLPLAIELAATRIRLLSPQAMLARLEQRLPLLTGGARDLPARQQTLRSAIGWSHDLLDERERTLFRRLAIFVGGCTLEAAETVCNAGRDLGIDMLDGVVSLVAQSLLREIGSDQEPRFGMLETIREYGLEMLKAAGELEALRRRHVEYFVALAEQRYPRFEGVLDLEWSAQMEREHDNLRAALTWSQQVAADVEAGPRLAGALWQFWHPHGHFREGRQWLERMLNEPAEPAVRARVLGGAAQLAMYHADYVSVEAYLDEARALWQQTGDQRGVAWTLHRLGNLALAVGDFKKAESLCAASVAFWRALGEKPGLHYALIPTATLALRVGDAKRAAALSEESAMLTRETGNQASLPYALGVAAQAAFYLGDDARATVICQEALVLFRQVGDRWGMLVPLRTLMSVAQRKRDPRQVAMLCREGLLILRDLGTRSSVDEHYEALAWVASTRGQPEQAARFLGASEALREATGTSIWPVRRADFDSLVAEVRAALSDEAFTTAWAAGRAMTLEQAVAYALEEQPSA